MIEEKVNQYGQKQKINNFDKIIKMGNKFLQIRMIETEHFRSRGTGKGFCKPMPRARFIDPIKSGIYYLVKREDIIEMNERTKSSPKESGK